MYLFFGRDPRIQVVIFCIFFIFIVSENKTDEICIEALKENGEALKWVEPKIIFIFIKINIKI